MQILRGSHTWIILELYLNDTYTFRVRQRTWVTGSVWLCPSVGRLATQMFSYRQGAPIGLLGLVISTFWSSQYCSVLISRNAHYAHYPKWQAKQIRLTNPLRLRLCYAKRFRSWIPNSIFNTANTRESRIRVEYQRIQFHNDHKSCWQFFPVFSFLRPSFCLSIWLSVY